MRFSRPSYRRVLIALAAGRAKAVSIAKAHPGENLEVPPPFKVPGVT